MARLPIKPECAYELRKSGPSESAVVNAVSAVAPCCGSDALLQRSQLGYRPLVGMCYPLLGETSKN